MALGLLAKPGTTTFLKAGTTTILDAVATGSTSGTGSTGATGSTGQQLYVAAVTGLDANPGTATQPKLTILGAMALATPGTTINVAPGTYPGGFDTTASGTAANPITYVSTVPGQARIFGGTGTTGGESVMWRLSGSYCVVQGFIFDGASSPKLKGLLYVTGGNNTVRHNTLQNYLTDSTQFAAQSPGGGASLGLTDFYQTAAAWHNTIDGNTITAAGPSGATGTSVHGISNDSQYTQITNNLIVGAAAAGIQSFGSPSFTHTNNNTISSCGYGIISGGVGVVATGLVTCNNIVANNTNGINESTGTVDGTSLYINNLTWNNTNYDYLLTSTNVQTGGLHADPLFFSSGSGNFGIPTNSPAVGRANTANCPTTDITGVQRLSSGPTGFDIGCYESVGLTDPTRITTTSGGTIADLFGNKWGLTSGGQVVFNTLTDTSTSGVTELDRISGIMWRRGTGGLWWYWDVDSSSWLPPSGQAATPFGVSTGGTTLAAPTNLTVTGTTATTAALSWGATPGTNITYVVQYAPHGQLSYTSLPETASLTNTITGLSSGVSYDVQVYAVQTIPTNVWGSNLPTSTKDIFVSATGSDANSGLTLALAKRTLLAANNIAIPGAIIRVSPGTYDGGFSLHANGTSTSARITYFSTTQYGAKIIGAGAPTGEGAGVAIFGNFTDFIGFEVDGSNTNARSWIGGVYLAGSNDRLIGSKIHDIMTDLTTYNTNNGNGNGGFGIECDGFYGGAGCVIDQNILYNVGPLSITGATDSLVQGLYVAMFNVVVTNNVVYDCVGCGIHLWHGNKNVDIFNNTVDSVGDVGITVGSGDGGSSSTTASGCRTANNITTNNGTGLQEHGTTGADNIYVNNTVFGNTNNSISLNNGLTATGTVTTNPLYTNEASRILTLQSISPSRGNASAAYETIMDVTGGTRSGLDRGAYSFAVVAGGTTQSPTTNAVNFITTPVPTGVALGTGPGGNLKRIMAFWQMAGMENHLGDTGAGAGGTNAYMNMTYNTRILGFMNPSGAGFGGPFILRDDTSTNLANIQQLAGLGYKMCLYFRYSPNGGNSWGSFNNQGGNMISMTAAGSVAYVEGPNEVENSGFGLVNHGGTYTALNGQTYSGGLAAVWWQVDLYNQMHSKTNCFGNVMPVILTSYGTGAALSSTTFMGAAASAGINLANYCDWSNVHSYCNYCYPMGATGGSYGGTAQLDAEANNETNVSGISGKVKSLTEMGMMHALNAADKGGTLSGQARILPQMYLDCFKRGYGYVAYYELTDRNASGASTIGHPGTSFEDVWGVSDLDGTPYEAAVVIRWMAGISADTGSNRYTFFPGSLTVSITNLSSQSGNLWFQKSSGAVVGFIWDNARIYGATGPSSGTVTPPVKTCTITFGAPYGTITVYEPNVGASAYVGNAYTGCPAIPTPIKTVSNTNNLTISMSDHMVMVVIAP